jgi:hypothetical protein
MNGLKEKAKTSYEISEDCYIICAKCKSELGDCGTEKCDATKTRWVKLEDAEQEIKKVKELGAEAMSIMVEGELKDLKQKLQQLLAEFPRKRWNEAFEWRDYATEEIDEWKQKFEELLKEEKEAE